MSRKKKLQHLSASPSTDTGLTFRLKPHTPTESKIVLTNTSGEFVAWVHFTLPSPFFLGIDPFFVVPTKHPHTRTTQMSYSFSLSLCVCVCVCVSLHLYLYLWRVHPHTPCTVRWRYRHLCIHARLVNALWSMNGTAIWTWALRGHVNIILHFTCFCSSSKVYLV